MNTISSRLSLIGAAVLLLPAVLLAAYAFNVRAVHHSDRAKLEAALAQTDRLTGELLAMESALENAGSESGTVLPYSGEGERFLRRFDSIAEALSMSGAEGSASLAEEFDEERSRSERLLQDLNFLAVQLQAGGESRMPDRELSLPRMRERTGAVREEIAELREELSGELRRSSAETVRVERFSWLLAALALAVAAGLLGAGLSSRGE